jgi:hypothetical protein
MRPEDTPWLNAHSLRIQIDEVLPVVIERARRDPDHQFSGRIQGKLLRILDVIREQYSSRLILDDEILELLLVQAPKELPVVESASPPEPITAEEMRIVLASVRASLLALEEVEEHTTPYGSTATAEVSPPWSPITKNLDAPPGQPGDWQGGPGDRQYWIGADRQHRRAASHRSSELLW